MPTPLEVLRQLMGGTETRPQFSPTGELVADILRPREEGLLEQAATAFAPAARNVARLMVPSTLQEAVTPMEEPSEFPPPTGPAESIARFAGRFAPDVALGTLTGGISTGVARAAAARGIPRLASTLLGEAAQSAVLFPADIERG